MTDARMLEVSVVTPEGSAYEGEALSVVAPAFDGEIAFYPMHAPFVGVLGHGEMRITRIEDDEEKVEYFYLAGGVVQVVDDHVSVLAETVLPMSELDAAKAGARLQEAMDTPARDAIRFVVAPPQDGFVTVVSLGAGGDLSVYQPPIEVRGMETPLPGSVVLDDSQGPERIIVLFSRQRLDPREALETTAARTSMQFSKGE